MMTYQIVLFKERGKFLVKTLGNKTAKQIEKLDKDTNLYEITIKDSTDILKIFHAGISYSSSKQAKY